MGVLEERCSHKFQCVELFFSCLSIAPSSEGVRGKAEVVGSNVWNSCFLVFLYHLLVEVSVKQEKVSLNIQSSQILLSS